MDWVLPLLSERFIEFLAAILTGLSGVAVTKFLKWITQKTTIELTDAQERRIKELAVEAIDAAEEWARSRKIAEATVTSEGKLEFATQHIRKHAKARAFGVEVQNGDAEDRVHAELGRRRSMAPLEGAGS